MTNHSQQVSSHLLPFSPSLLVYDIYCLDLCLTFKGDTKTSLCVALAHSLSGVFQTQMLCPLQRRLRRVTTEVEDVLIGQIRPSCKSFV